MDFLFFRMFAVLSIVCACEFQFLLVGDERKTKTNFDDSLRRNGGFEKVDRALQGIWGRFEGDLNKF